MILIYSLVPIAKDIDKHKILLKERLSPFFITDDDILITTESNPQLLKEMIINHKVFLFFTESIAMMGFCQNDLIDLIIFMVKNKCSFRSEIDNVSIGFDNMDIFESIISDKYN